MEVFLVVTHGRGSIDLYSIRLAQHLKIPKLHTDVYQRISALFGKSLADPSLVKGIELLLSFSKKLNEIPGIPHFPNHHLGRFAYFLNKPFIVTVHDIMRYLDILWNGTLISKPSSQDKLWLTMDFKAIKKAAKVIVPSNHTKKDLVKYLKVPEEKIEVIPHGVDDFKPRLGRRPCKEPYILYVGTEHPRKNLKTAFKAFKLLKEESPRFKDLKFVKVGRAGGKERCFREETLRIINSLGIAKDVIFISWVSKEELESYYTQAELFIFPSIYEGFGWPPLEAMQCNCPVIASNTTSIPEVLGDATILLSPLNVKAWKDAMEEVLTDESLRKELVEKGASHAKKFSWKKAAERTLKVYQEILESS
ncbi:MAG: glycosyltransferase family 1 protein [Candidatus Methanomethylicota archaeon]|uniref:Glycosyltransferase family 1 protein n=1 Tax=Thermoproteota archaeon TaxID=2056631 RepID=A0A497F3B7_9CREN|nr:MAG: glycosyltransferase family 1 protein [Candidatus Verstraetearchaeota archaeon]RLE53380.1 MAG: glycosyltransferase family 1 protein [Candidatus Verstraetearchaeota archaeon]